MAKINSTELAKIIAEETEKVLLEEGFFSQMGAGLKGAAGRVKGAAGEVGSAIKSAAQQVKQGYQQGKYNKEIEEEIIGKVAAFLNAAESYPEAKEFVKKTDLGKQLYGLNEQYGEQQILQMLRSKGLTDIETLAEFVNQANAASSSSKEIADLVRMSGLDGYVPGAESDETQTGATKQEVPSPQAVQDEPAKTQTGATKQEVPSPRPVKTDPSTPKPEPLPSSVSSPEDTQVDKTQVDKTQVDKTQVDKTVTDFGAAEDEAQIISARNYIENGELSKAIENLKDASQSVQPAIANMIANKLKQTYKF